MLQIHCQLQDYLKVSTSTSCYLRTRQFSMYLRGQLDQFSEQSFVIKNYHNKSTIKIVQEKW